MNARVAYRLCAVLLLVVIGAHRLATFQRPAGVERYHERIRQSAAGVPRLIGAWAGDDIEVPTQAISMLLPNVLISRRYTSIENGMSVGLLLVHCSDAHDMAGHFPSRCYPAAGWVRTSSRPRDWKVGDLTITGTEYEFSMAGGVGWNRPEQHMVVANCLLRPGGRILRDMDALASSSLGAIGQATGAGQIQVYFDASVPQRQRDQIFERLIRGYRPVLDAILAPVDR